MNGDRGGFTPKGFINLREAIEVIGKATGPDWTGAEQKSDNWELLDGDKVQDESKVLIWLQIMGIKLERYGNAFQRAAEDYWLDCRNHPEDAADLQRLLPFYNYAARKSFVGDADGAKVEMLHTARRIHYDAMYKRDTAGWPHPYNRVTEGWVRPHKHRFHCPPPIIEGDDGPTYIGLDSRSLEAVEEGVDAFLREREATRRQRRERAEQVWKLLRPELHAGTFECIVLKEGASTKIEPAIWATDGAKPLFIDCVSDGSEIFVSDNVVSLSRSGSDAGASETSRLDREGADSTGGASAPPELVPTPKRGRPGTGDRAATVYERRFPDGHETEGLTLKGACNEIAKSDGPTVAPKTLARALKARGIQ